MNLFALLVALATAWQLAEAQTDLTVFWYTDVDDLIAGKAPDKQFTKDDPFYGTNDPNIGPTETRDAEQAMDDSRGSVHPTGSDINKVKYDPKLEDAAINSAKRCESDSAGLNPNLAEIVVASTTRLSFKDAIQMVRAEAVNFDVATNKCKKQNYPPCEQYRLLLNSGLTSFACGRAHCPDTAMPYRVHCVLSPKPTRTDVGPYTPGTPCQLCPRDRGYCYKSQCVSHDDKTNIQRQNPHAVVTCSAPCLNCGVRRDVNKVCSCHCPVGFASALDCSVADSGANASSLTCGMCERVGRACQNGGIESPESVMTCRGCLCTSDWKGDTCEIPANGYNGGVKVPVVGPNVCTGSATCGSTPPNLDQLPKDIDIIKTTLSTEINKFCKSSQENYIKCCGVGTLPTSGPTDFVNPADVSIIEPIKFDENGRAIVPLYATVKGNNGLCRKTTTEPPPIVPVPPEVIKEIIKNDKPKFDSTNGSGTKVNDVSGTVKEDLGPGVPVDISALIITI